MEKNVQECKQHLIKYIRNGMMKPAVMNSGDMLRSLSETMEESRDYDLLVEPKHLSGNLMSMYDDSLFVRCPKILSEGQIPMDFAYMNPCYFASKFNDAEKEEIIKALAQYHGEEVWEWGVKMALFGFNCTKFLDNVESWYVYPNSFILFENGSAVISSLYEMETLDPELEEEGQYSMAVEFNWILNHIYGSKN